MGNIIYIDNSDVEKKLGSLSLLLSEPQMRKLAKRTVSTVGRKVKKITLEAVERQYVLDEENIKKDFMRIRTRGTANGGECIFPIQGVKHIIGGKTIPATGGAYGWQGIEKGKRYKITFQILQGKVSELPEEMKDQGGHPPFRNLSAEKLHGGAYTRQKNKKLPIARLVARAVPEMAKDRAKTEIVQKIEARLAETLESTIDKEFDKVIRG